MQPEAYAVEAEVEATHWWFVGRRGLFASSIAGLGVPAAAPVLDIGTSTGTNLRMLRDIGMRNVVGLDFSEEAIRFCKAKGLGDVRQGDACALPFPAETFDLVLATDIIEHVDDDGKALSEIGRVLGPGGQAIVTVPAFHCLWGLQDAVAMHKRRYRMPELVGKVHRAGFSIKERYYFNYFLFLPILIARRLMRLFPPRIASENELNSPIVNALLRRIFALDVLTARHVHPPFGASIFMVLEKPQ